MEKTHNEGTEQEQVKRCALCGAVLEINKHGKKRKYCYACSGTVYKRAWSEKQRALHPRPCERCGRQMELRQQKYCRACAEEMKDRKRPTRQDIGTENDEVCRMPVAPPAAGAADTALGRARKQAARRLRLSGAEIDRLALEYDPPYNSYGKLRAYIDAYDALPPARFLKSAHPNAVDQYARPEDR